MAGPAVLLGYGVAGIIAFLIMRQLGEMVVEEPVSGSFAHFAYKYWGPFAGFLSGWNYWVLYVLVAMAELTAVGKYIQFWFPDIPNGAAAAVFFVLIIVSSAIMDTPSNRREFSSGNKTVTILAAPHYAVYYDD
ncbi:amino acid permease-associated region [Lactobacillus buchneri NRRL B-30929] [Dolosigranulum pigrum]|nr:amino acid permease-associated region [Lactobacillus buchneri NRRL B-30929] [Dolosigranulum pigrum]